MKGTLSKSLSEGRLAELFQLTKLKTLTDDEEAIDKSYLEAMILSAAKIDTIDAAHLLPATHAFDSAQRLRQDQVTEEKGYHKVYQEIAPAMVNGLYSVPAVIE